MSLHQKIWGLGLLTLAVTMGIVWAISLATGAATAPLWGAAVGGGGVLLVMGLGARLIYGGVFGALTLCLRNGCEPGPSGRSGRTP